MKNYIGIKAVQAEPCTKREFEGQPASAISDDMYGYRVRYADGYTSWSPAKAFEEAYVEVPVEIAGALVRRARTALQADLAPPEVQPIRFTAALMVGVGPADDPLGGANHFAIKVDKGGLAINFPPGTPSSTIRAAVRDSIIAKLDSAIDAALASAAPFTGDDIATQSAA